MPPLPHAHQQVVQPLHLRMELLITVAFVADRVFGILRQHNPELTGEKRRTIMKPPQARVFGCVGALLAEPAHKITLSRCCDLAPSLVLTLRPV